MRLLKHGQAQHVLSKMLVDPAFDLEKASVDGGMRTLLEQLASPLCLDQEHIQFTIAGPRQAGKRFKTEKLFLHILGELEAKHVSRDQVNAELLLLCPQLGNGLLLGRLLAAHGCAWCGDGGLCVV